MRLSKNILFLPLIIILALPAYRFLLQPGFFTTMDGHLHIYKAIELNRALNEGQFPVRWGANLANGYGLPVYNFYSPLFYYLTSFIAHLGPTFVESVKIVLILNFIIASFAMFLLAKEFWGQWGGLTSAILFVYAPYFFVNVYVRGAFPEALTFSVIPLIFWSMTRFFKTSGRIYLVLGGLFSALLPLAHNFLALAAFPFLLLFVLVQSLKKKTLLAFAALGMGLLASSFFWLPVLLEKKYLLPEVFTNNYDYRDSFLYLHQLFYSAWGYEGNVKGPNDGMSFMIGLPLIFLIPASLITAFTLKKETRKWQKLFFFSFLGALFMTLSISAWVWRLIPPLQVAQFPWRFLVLVVFFGSCLAGSSLLAFKKKSRALMAMFITILTVGLNLGYAQGKDHNRAYSDNTYSGHHLGIPRAPVIGDDYTPTWVKQRPEEPAARLVNPTNFEKGSFKGHHYSFEVNLENPQVFTFNTYYYPGWTGFVDDQKKEVQITDNGLFQLIVPAGRHRVEVKFIETPLRQKADYLSLAGLGGLLVLGLITPGWIKTEKRLLKLKAKKD